MCHKNFSIKGRKEGCLRSRDVIIVFWGCACGVILKQYCYPNGDTLVRLNVCIAFGMSIDNNLHGFI